MGRDAVAGMLYYPFFNAPPPVIHQAVLYWDNLATVVAGGWRERISDPMRAVQDAGLYRPITPDSEYPPLRLNAIEAQLEHAIYTVPLDRLMPPGDDFDERISVLHLDKLHGSVVETLRGLGLVREIPSMPSRLIASPTLVHLVVSLLADDIARQANDEFGLTSPVSLRPHTDVRAAHQIALAPVQSRPSMPCWRIDISGLLPVPTGPVEIGELLRFREAHDAERRVMMRAIDDLMMGLAYGQHPQDVLERVGAELTDAATALRDAARSSKWRWRRRSIAALLVAEAALYGQSLITASPDGFAAATLSLFGSVAVNIATDSTRGDLPEIGGAARYRYLHEVRRKIAF